MVKQILFLTSTVLLLAPILSSQEVSAQSRKIEFDKAQPASVRSPKKVESGSSILGVHEINLNSIQTKPPSPTLSKGIAIEKPRTVRLLPVYKRNGTASPAEEDEGLQVQVTPVD
ncbi:hypothetical protein [Altericista sp. CCNU0014]|uniref:hypothetical protein n=1 Tax=Altericista sp. CCNU0014 TaxID=3082949 RepID=UPI00384CBAAD